MAKFTHKKSLGQNFLKNESIIEQIVDGAEIDESDVVIEVGPGQGVLTEALVHKASKVIAVELDDRLIPFLQERFADYDNVDIVHGSILHMNIPELLSEHAVQEYKVVANIPYYITAPIIRLFLENANAPSEIVLMIQKEVAERITAEPGDMSILAISAQYYAQVDYLFTVSREEFEPVPEVDSAVVRLKINNNNVKNAEEVHAFFRAVKIGFSAKRKTLLNNIANGFHKDKGDVEIILEKSGISLNARAQELSLDEWKILARLLKD